ncbi:citrulline utilization hydrolase CtlX [Microbacterium saperdae]|nr:arginine deiminase-related protein [Microbacterium saperdae]
MIRPHHFHVNPQTLSDNAFQSADDVTASEVSRRARDEVDQAAFVLRRHGVEVELFDDDRVDRPDAVFPNNWFSTHADGKLVLYPMHAPNRRSERRADVIEHLRHEFEVSELVDLTAAEDEGRALEGTGAIVFDHSTRIAFMARSQRTDDGLFEQVCDLLGYRPHRFDTADSEGLPVYHTNVLLSIGESFAVLCPELLPHHDERGRLREALETQERTVIDLDVAQIGDFAANILELDAPSGPIIAMSTRAHTALTRDQRRALEKGAKLVRLDIPTIERAGGSVRCMLAEIRLGRRDALPAVS